MISLHAVMDRLPELRAKLAHLVFVSRSESINVSVLCEERRPPMSLYLMQEGQLQNH